MALKNYYTKEEYEMQELVQKQIDLAGFGGEGFTEKQVNQIHEYAQMVERCLSMIHWIVCMNASTLTDQMTLLGIPCQWEILLL